MTGDPPDAPDDDDRWLRDAARAPRAAIPLCPGDHLGRYRILEELGRGGMGVVYVAEDERLRREVALKVLPTAARDDGERNTRFVREARLAAGLAHPAIAVVYDAGEIDERSFIAMELVRGKTLRARLDEGPLPLPEIRAIARAIAAGLAAAHRARVVHRDLKPENVVIASDGAVKILDFGIAKSSGAAGRSAVDSTATREGHVIGTPAYMSPEQAKGAPVDARSDVFSFGILLYEMIAGSRPFDGNTPIELALAIHRDDPPPLATRAPAVFERLVRTCLAKRPEERFPSGEELLAALDDETMASSRPSRRRPWQGPVAIAALVLAPLTWTIVRSGGDPVEASNVPTASVGRTVASIASVAAATSIPLERPEAGSPRATTTTSAAASVSTPSVPPPMTRDELRARGSAARRVDAGRVPGPLDEPK